MIEPSQRVQETKESYIRNILKVIQQPGMLSLAGGLPDASRFPKAILAQAAQHLADDPSIYQYGATEGYAPLRKWLIDSLALADDVMVTSGSQQALDLIARSYLNPGDQVLCEAPSYLGALQIFDLAQAKTLTVKSDSTGPDLDHLESMLSQNQIKLFYAVPDFQNPSSSCWTLEKRQGVALLCERFDVAFIEDAPYRELRYSGETLPSVSSLCKGQAFYMGSFSKIATPSMRVGFVMASQKLLEPLKKVKQASDLHSALPMQQMLLATITHPEFPAHLEQLKQHYCARRDVLVDALNRHLSDWIDFEVPEGGMFVWAKLKQHQAHDLAAKALDYQVAVVPGDEFWPSDASIDYQAIRLNFTALDDAQLEQAVERLAEVMSNS
ncbi:PLP-dependent aminotransferase family protein [Alginatibacterium sediminis]|uniref:PLP-dependent aminotransferase family protein n=1 Tax=Alginatibacterium sediminis TaxID=2164068 RepID=A0A420ELF9_9ALTE|nr:PLP-dependent aminotransferase family protein [Alginatibacterium sediminis]RKF21552.1 PLP-dependent aminotransferase family protein [Alginatibacterium sediminis]